VIFKHHKAFPYQKSIIFFISDCQLDSSSITIFKIKEVWLENKWKYKLNFGIAEREKTGGYQLNLALDSFVNPNFQSNNYTIKWDMKNSSDEYLGAQGNLFTLFLKGQNIPDTFYINIVQIDENRVRRYYNCFKIKRIN
jgi:hypothetical protein